MLSYMGLAGTTTINKLEVSSQQTASSCLQFIMSVWHRSPAPACSPIVVANPVATASINAIPGFTSYTNYIKSSMTELLKKKNKKS